MHLSLKLNYPGTLSVTAPILFLPLASDLHFWVYFTLFYVSPTVALTPGGGKGEELGENVGSFTTNLASYTWRKSSVHWLTQKAIAEWIHPVARLRQYLTGVKNARMSSLAFGKLPLGVKGLSWQALVRFVGKLGSCFPATQWWETNTAVPLQNSFQVSKMCFKLICRTKIIDAES